MPSLLCVRRAFDDTVKPYAFSSVTRSSSGTTTLLLRRLSVCKTTLFVPVVVVVIDDDEAPFDHEHGVRGG